MLIVFAIQHRGILGTANVQKYHRPDRHHPDADRRHRSDPHRPDQLGQLLAASCRSPPPTRPSPARGTSPAGRWCFGGMFIAAWSTYALRDRRSATPASSRTRHATRSRRSSIRACSACVLYILVPFTFQGVLGLEGMLATPIVDGSGVGRCHGRAWSAAAGIITSIMVMLMILALMLAIMTAMAGSSRTLYQGSVDGWLPRYLSHVNAHGAPTRGDVDRPRLQPVPAGHRGGRCDELLLHPRRLELRLHHLQLPQPQRRLDPPHRQRPHPAAVEGADLLHRASAACSPSSTPCSWAPAPRSGTRWALWAGIIAAALIIPVFWFRHYVQDGGKFPPHMLDDLGMKPVRSRRAQGGHAALSDAGGRRGGGAARQLDLRHLT